jgi:hypothetical protein
MTITLTLNSGSVSTAAGPFTVSGTTDGGSLNDVNMTTGSISTTQLTSGWSYNDTTDTITGGTINSSGTCITGKTWLVIAATPTPTPTPTALPCGCFTVYNESGDRSIIFQYVRCSDGNLTSTSVASGANKTVCVQSGTDIESDDIGLLTVVDCGTSCTINDDCTPCS